MHIALNAWFWDQPYTGSGQYVRGLVRALEWLRQNESPYAALRLTLIAPQRSQPLQDVPTGVQTRYLKAGKGQIGKVLFEQRAFPKAVGEIRADIAHVPIGRRRSARPPALWSPSTM